MTCRLLIKTYPIKKNIGKTEINIKLAVTRRYYQVLVHSMFNPHKNS